MRASRMFQGRRRTRLLFDKSGNVTTMAALSLPFVLAAAAIGIDSASLYSQRRDAQALADLAAITAAANLDKAELAAETVLHDNGIRNVHVVTANTRVDFDLAGGDAFALSVVRGRYVANTQTAVVQRFVAGLEPFNAVQATISRLGQRHFGGAFIRPPEIVTKAVASVPAEAVFSVGSRLASLNGGIVNGLLSQLIGAQVSLTAVDYNALLAADVELFQFMDALASELHLTAATYSDVLDANAKMSTVASALARTPGVSTATKRALQDLATASSRTGEPTFKLSRFINAGNAGKLKTGEGRGFDAKIGVMQLISGSAEIANGTHQVSVNLGATIPGLAKVTLDLAIGEPAQNSSSVAVGEAGATVHTAQVRLLISVEIGGPGGLLGTKLTLPLYLELATADARLTSVTCPSGRPESMRVAVSAKPGVLDARIASFAVSDLANFSRNPAFAAAKIVEAPLVTVSGSARVQMTNMTASTLTFDRDDIDDRVIKTVSTHDLTQSLTQSLIGNLHLSVQVAGLGIGIPSNLTQTVSNLLGAVTPTVDSVLASVLATLGVRVGEADVRVHGASCGRSVLVQ